MSVVKIFTDPTHVGPIEIPIGVAVRLLPPGPASHDVKDGVVQGTSKDHRRLFVRITVLLLLFFVVVLGIGGGGGGGPTCQISGRFA